MNILLLPFGTSGSIFPFIWFGKKLLERGHRVTMITSPCYAGRVLEAGIRFLAPEVDALADMLKDPDLWNRQRCSQVAYAHGGRFTAPVFKVIDQFVREQGAPDLMLAPMISFGARLAREKFGIPLITVHLHPLAMMNTHEVPLLFPAIRWLRLLPHWIRKRVLSLPSPYDAHALPSVQQACRDQGVLPPRRIWQEWYHSPDGVLALYPDWFGSLKRERPHNTFQWGFPLEDMAEQTSLDPNLLRFLAMGEEPVLFTPGTGQVHANAFFDTALKLVLATGCRAIFLTGKPDQVPPNLPDSIFVTAYAPFGKLLPHSRAMVHHGGVGTLSQCMKAGVPQLIVAMSFDQPDNAERVTKLGVGVGMDAGDFTLPNALPLLQRCLNDEGLRHRAREIAGRLPYQPPIEDLMEWLESVRLVNCDITTATTPA